MGTLWQLWIFYEKHNLWIVMNGRYLHLADAREAARYRRGYGMTVIIATQARTDRYLAKRDWR